MAHSGGKRFWIVLGIAAMGVAIVLATQRHHDTPTAEAASRPNIVVIMTDDQRKDDMWVMGQTQALLAQQGVTFANNFVSYSLCCPSRSTFLTGQYAHNHGVLGNNPPAGSYAKLDHRNTLPIWLSSAGYYTAHIGKYLNGYGELDAGSVEGVPPTERPSGWTEWYGGVDPSTYSMYGFTLNENGTTVTYPEQQTGAFVACDDHPEDGKCYQTDVYGRKAADFIRRRAQTIDGKPFFLSVAFLAAHKEHVEDDIPITPTQIPPRPAPRHAGQFDTLPLPTFPSFNEQDMSDKPLFLRLLPWFGAMETQLVTNWYRRRLESLLAVDEAVRDVVKTLEATGQLQNTVVIFTSDNGFFYGEHRIPTGKGLVYEESLRVPLAIRGPGLPAGQTRTHLAVNVDLAPTIVELAQASALRVMDGRSLVPLMKDPAIDWRKEFLSEGFAGVASYAAVRTGRYVYAEYSTGGKEFYDLAADPYQLQSKHTSGASVDQARMATLKLRLNALKSCSGTGCW